MTSNSSHTASGAFAMTLAAALFMSAAAVVNAGEACDTHASAAMSDVPSRAVSYSDLNLATAQGNRTLLRRIESAAAKVCPATSAPGALPSRVRDCRDEAIARAVSDTKSSQLAELHAARGRRVAST